MALENVTLSLGTIGAGLGDSIKLVITVLQIIGGLIGIYLIFWIVNFFLNVRKNKILKEILQNLKEINIKLEKKK